MQRCSKQYLFHILWECVVQGQHGTQRSQRFPTQGQGPSEASTQIIIMSRSLLISCEHKICDAAFKVCLNVLLSCAFGQQCSLSVLVLTYVASCSQAA